MQSHPTTHMQTHSERKNSFLKRHPDSYDALTGLVKEFFLSLDNDRNLCEQTGRSVVERYELCLNEDGGHFEHLMDRRRRVEE